MANNSKVKFNKRKERNRFSIKKVSYGVPRLSVFRSVSNIYAQIIDDTKGVTLVSASTVDPELKGSLKVRSNVDAAEKVGALLGKRAVEAGLDKVVFDRGGFKFHGRVKAVAEAARLAGLKF